MSHKSAPPTVSTIGIDLGKNSFHLVGLDQRGAIVLLLKCSRAQLERRLANIPRCLIGMEACSGAHYIGRQLAGLGHDVRLIPAQYVKPFLKGHKNDYRDAEAIAEAVQRPTMHFVAIKTPEQMDLLALHPRALDKRRDTNHSSNGRRASFAVKESDTRRPRPGGRDLRSFFAAGPSQRASLLAGGARRPGALCMPRAPGSALPGLWTIPAREPSRPGTWAVPLRLASAAARLSSPLANARRSRREKRRSIRIS